MIGGVLKGTPGKIAGGIMLFLIALEMVFEKRTERRENRAQEVSARETEDISVFPMAIPMIPRPAPMAIVGMTVIVRLAIVPLTIKQIKSMNALRELEDEEIVARIVAVVPRWSGATAAPASASCGWPSTPPIPSLAAC